MELAKFITGSLAPAVAMSTAALLATGLQARYGEIVKRIRALADERRELGAKDALTSAEGERHFSLQGQLTILMRRARLMQSAIMLIYLSIFCFLATSFAIAFIVEEPGVLSGDLPKYLFLGGMGSVAVGVFLEVLEMRLAFRIIKYEVGAISPVQT
jgi:hypothetical protein